MIPLREQEYIRELFEESLTGPVKLEFFTQRHAPVFVPGREECQFCDDVQQMLTELSHLSDKVSLRVHELAKAPAEAKKYGVERVPATVLRGVLNRPLLLYGMPGGTLFSFLIEACVAVSTSTGTSTAALKKKLKRIRRDLPVRVFTTMEDEAGGHLARQVAGIALESGRVHAEVIEVGEFPTLAEQQGAQTVPLTLIDNRVRLSGFVPPDEMLDQIIRASETTAVTSHARLPGGGVALDVPQADEVQRGETRPSGLIVPRR
jgi:alkyl hydroperoxide reductase subunit AhpF